MTRFILLGLATIALALCGAGVMIAFLFGLGKVLADLSRGICEWYDAIGAIFYGLVICGFIGIAASSNGQKG